MPGPDHDPQSGHHEPNGLGNRGATHHAAQPRQPGPGGLGGLFGAGRLMETAHEARSEIMQEISGLRSAIDGLRSERQFFRRNFPAAQLANGTPQNQRLGAFGGSDQPAGAMWELTRWGGNLPAGGIVTLYVDSFDPMNLQWISPAINANGDFVDAFGGMPLWIPAGRSLLVRYSGHATGQGVVNVQGFEHRTGNQMVPVDTPEAFPAHIAA